jgi:hypothetical protein
MRGKWGILVAGILLGALCAAIVFLALGRSKPSQPVVTAAGMTPQVVPHPISESVGSMSAPSEPETHSLPVPAEARPVSNSSPVVTGPTSIPVQYLPVALQDALREYPTLTETEKRTALANEVLGMVEIKASPKEVAQVLGAFLRQESDLDVKLEVIENLGLLDDPVTLEQVLPGLDAQQPQEVRVAAIEVLGNIGDLRAKPYLRQLLADRDPAIRDAAQSALESFPEE